MKGETKSGAASGLGKHMRTRFMSGLLVLIPLAVTVFVLNVILRFLTAFARPLMKPWVGELPESVLTLIALFATALIVYFVGSITTHIVGRRLFSLGEKILLKLPVVKSVYAASKQVVDTFSSSSKASFQAVAFVEFPRRGSRAIGFITGSMPDPSGTTLYRVFIATTPNPTSGFLLLMPEADIQFTDISVEEGLKMIVSGGVLAPAHYRIVGPSASPSAPRE